MFRLERIIRSAHPLDHPIWSALTTRQRMIAEGGALARRFPLAIAPFAATADASPESFAALGALASLSDRIILFTPDPVALPDGFEVRAARSAQQMIGVVSEISTAVPDVAALGADDVPAMMELAELTRPGPFSLRTHELGTFLGVRAGGRLVAMAGERMKPAGYTEITAVCTRPEHRGQGYAQALLGAISRGIAARGETPFLHVCSDNEPAIALYRRKGMSIRRHIEVTMLSARA